MGKKKACQHVRVLRPLDTVETHLYGWVEGAVLTQPSLVGGDLLPEFRRNYPLMEDSGAEGDYVLEAAGPSDRDPKGRRIFVPQESEVEGELPSAEEIAPEQDPVVVDQTSQPEAGDAVGGSGECPT
ncbi:hypothetical protein PIB30_053105 [Stylosanthes scabra]|uniref:Uncharacterized protein n=1 Tax=Stylosanthes scabra TaxID=79078 RepID=A0ABU6UIS1_9FABA|nr:hypothetical protein [Stylosanthes scabra]